MARHLLVTAVLSAKFGINMDHIIAPKAPLFHSYLVQNTFAVTECMMSAS